MSSRRKPTKDTTLPHDIAAEAAVLGSMIVDPPCIAAVLQTVSAEMYFVREHRTIFDAIVTLHTRNGGILDGLLVRAELENRKQLEAIGGADYLQQILDKVPSSASVQYYADIVVDRYQRRQAIAAAERLLANAMDPATQIAEELHEARRDLDEIGEPDGDAETLPAACLDSIEAEEVSWFWPNVLADRSLNLLVGDPGTAKSYQTHGLAACISSGRHPAGLPDIGIPRGSVGLFACEDSPGIIRTRIERNGGNCGNIYIIPEPVDIATKTGLIERFLEEHPDCRALVFDPITSYLGDINTNATAEVRAAMKPLMDMIAERRVMVLAVNHLNKRQDLSPIYRSAGAAGGLVALARSVWGVAIDKDDNETRIFYPVKSNYAIRPTGLKFRIVEGVVTYEPSPWTGSIDDHLRPTKQSGGSKLRVEECAEWLQDRLRAGATQSNTIIEEAADAGYNRDLCYRAKDRLGIRASRSGFGKAGAWFWSLPGNGEVVHA